VTKDQSLIRKLRKALAFYADPSTYFAIGIFPDKPCGSFINDFSSTELNSKPGKRARKAFNLEGKI